MRNKHLIPAFRQSFDTAEWKQSAGKRKLLLFSNFYDPLQNVAAPPTQRWQ